MMTYREPVGIQLQGIQIYSPACMFVNSEKIVGTARQTDDKCLLFPKPSIIIRDRDNLPQVRELMIDTAVYGIIENSMKRKSFQNNQWKTYQKSIDLL